MALVEVLYPFGGAKRGDRITVPDEKVGALRRLKWAREIEVPPPVKVAARSRVRSKVKEPGIDANISTETE